MSDADLKAAVVRKFLRSELRKLVGLLAWLLLAASAMPFLYGAIPLFSLSEHFARQIAGIAAIIAFAAVVMRNWTALAVCLVVVAWNTALIWPSMTIQVTPRNGPVMKVLSLNLWYLNKDPNAVVSYLVSSGADVVGLVEVTPNWAEPLKSLDTAYPYRVDCLSAGIACEVALFSKHPFKQSSVGPAPGIGPELAWAEIDANGRSISVVETHLTWPFEPAAAAQLAATSTDARPVLAGAPRLAQSQQAANLAEFLNTLGPDLVVMGDFNSTPWSRVQGAFREATGLKNAPGLIPTWPVWGWSIIRLPLDQIFTRGDLIAEKFKTGPDLGSDHLPVEATIVIAK